MRILYSLALYLLAPLALLRLLWRSRRLPAYRSRWAERFAYFDAPPRIEGAIWMHAVSVGEVIAAAPLIRRLMQTYPNIPVVVTTMTPTGSEQVRSHFPDEEVFHIYAPYDLPGVVKRFIRKIKPCIAIMMETELWPNILYYCKQQHIPVVVANARLSQRSAKGYARFSKLVRKMLANISVVIAQNKADAERYVFLGVPRSHIKVTGSIKFDLQLPASVYESSEALRQQWGSDRAIWIAASTHEGEEEQILSAFAAVRVQIPNMLLILVPRHPERFSKVANLCRKQKLTVALRSKQESCHADTDVYLGDTMGELTLFYAASDVAFVGGSLMPIGGHNLLEPAVLGVPMVVGPYMFNFEEINRQLKQAGAVVQIDNSIQLAKAIIHYFNDPELRFKSGEQGRKVVARNRGALEAHVAIIGEQM